MANTAITVTFVTEDELTDAEGNIYTSLQVELDSDRNEGETRFLFGSKAYYRIFKSPTDLVIAQTQSDGIITSEGVGTEEITEYITFADTNKGTIGYPLDSIVSAAWLGNDLGALSYVGNIVTASQTGVGVLKVVYNAIFTRHAISVNVDGETEYAVLIYITGTLPEPE
jgi:hypothetical protein